MRCALKICGVVRPEDLVACVELGVDAVGINLWRGSPRSVALPDACDMLTRAGLTGHRTGRPRIVAVLVDPDPADLEVVWRQLRPDAIQLHGHRDVASYPDFDGAWVRVVRGTPDLDTLAEPDPEPAWTLLDAAVAGFGGAGVRTDWTWASAVVRWLAPHPVWLAGGITPDNAAEAIAAVAPAGIDVASGAEVGGGAPPGHKSRARIAALAEICGSLRG